MVPFTFYKTIMLFLAELSWNWSQQCRLIVYSIRHFPRMLTELGTSRLWWWIEILSDSWLSSLEELNLALRLARQDACLSYWQTRDLYLSSSSLSLANSERLILNSASGNLLIQDETYLKDVCKHPDLIWWNCCTWYLIRTFSVDTSLGPFCEPSYLQLTNFFSSRKSWILPDYSITWSYICTVRSDQSVARVCNESFW